MNLPLNSKTIKSAVFFVGMILGACAMSADIELHWEWPADRNVDQKLLVKVTSIQADKGGFFGLKNSASVAGGFPDPQVFQGVIEKTNDDLNGKTIKLTLPKLEIENIDSGDYVVLGIINPSTCICIVRVDSSETDLSQVSCP